MVALKKGKYIMPPSLPKALLCCISIQLTVCNLYILTTLEDQRSFLIICNQPVSQRTSQSFDPGGKAEPVWSSALSTVVTHENTSLSILRALLSGIRDSNSKDKCFLLTYMERPEQTLLVWSASLCASPPGGRKGELMAITSVTNNTCTKPLLVGILDS